MFKKLLSRTLAASALTASLMLCASTTARAAEGDEFTDGNLKFIVLSEEEHTVALSGYVEAPTGELVIPSQANNGTSDYTVTQISHYCFSYCEEISTISIPSTITYIGNEAFSYCYNLESIIIPESIEWMGNDVFYHCETLKSASLPNSFTIIPTGIFSQCYSLENVTIPENATVICGGAFYDCKSLPSIKIPEAVTDIQYSAFSGCIGLTSLVIPKSVKNIMYNAFYGCLGLISLEIQAPNIQIGDWAFAGCTGITSLKFTEPIGGIGSQAFASTGLTSLVLPAGYFQIGGGAFSGCLSLEEIKVEEGESYYLSNDGVLFNIYGTLNSFPGAKTKYIVPDFCVGLSTGAFYGCSNLASIELPNTIKNIEQYGFKSCSSLSTIILPNSVEELGYGAFWSCTSLETLTLPESIKTLQANPFWECSSLRGLYVLSKTPPETNNMSFWNISRNLPIYIPEGTLPTYSSTANWSEFTNYVEMPPFTLTLDEELAVEMGQTAVLTAQIEKAEDVTVESESWLSFNSEVATVDENGVVTGVAEGTALIACTVVDSFGCDHREFCKVTVTPTSGIGSIEATGSDTPAVYYNLNGMRVDGNALTPGFYIKRQGTKAEKILVK